MEDELPKEFDLIVIGTGGSKSNKTPIILNILFNNDDDSFQHI